MNTIEIHTTTDKMHEYYGRDDWYEYTRNLKLECIAYSRGTYGANGAEWISRADGELYAVGSRNCALASLF